MQPQAAPIHLIRVTIEHQPFVQWLSYLTRAILMPRSSCRWPSRAVTFVDNHDTGSTQQHWPFPADRVGAGYAYILTHPGIPCIFWDHYFTWGAELHNIIHTLAAVRDGCGAGHRDGGSGRLH